MIIHVYDNEQVMVDIATFNRMNPEYREFGTSGHDSAMQQQVNQIQQQMQVEKMKSSYDC